MMSKDNEKNYRKMLELQQSIQYLQQYLQEIEAQVQELEMIHDSLQDFSKEDEGKEILVPIVNGIFFKGKITDKSKFLVNIGAKGTVVEMAPEEAKDLILKQITKTRENYVLLTQELNKLIKEMEKYS